MRRADHVRDAGIAGPAARPRGSMLRNDFAQAASSAPSSDQHAAAVRRATRAPRRPCWSRARRRTSASTTATLPRAGVHAERRPQRAPARLAVHLHGVAARAWGRMPRRRPSSAAARIDPARARPVPFWRHGFAPPPLHLAARAGRGRAAPARELLGARRLVDDGVVERLGEDLGGQLTVPWRAELRRLRTRPQPSRTSTERALGARDRAPQDQQVALAVDVHDLEARAG